METVWHVDSLFWHHNKTSMGSPKVSVNYCTLPRHDFPRKAAAGSTTTWIDKICTQFGADIYTCLARESAAL